jgi:hypothetical protein
MCLQLEDIGYLWAHEMYHVCGHSWYPPVNFVNIEKMWKLHETPSFLSDHFPRVSQRFFHIYVNVYRRVT